MRRGANLPLPPGGGLPCVGYGGPTGRSGAVCGEPGERDSAVQGCLSRPEGGLPCVGYQVGQAGVGMLWGVCGEPGWKTRFSYPVRASSAWAMSWDSALEALVFKNWVSDFVQSVPWKTNPNSFTSEKGQRRGGGGPSAALFPSPPSKTLGKILASRAPGNPLRRAEGGEAVDLRPQRALLPRLRHLGKNSGVEDRGETRISYPGQSHLCIGQRVSSRPGTVLWRPLFSKTGFPISCEGCLGKPTQTPSHRRKGKEGEAADRLPLRPLLPL